MSYEEAKANVLRYIASRQAKPMRALDDEIHSLHVGTEFEGSLGCSDLVTVMARIAALEAEVARLRKIEKCVTELLEAGKGIPLGMRVGKEALEPWYAAIERLRAALKKDGP